MRYWMIKRLWGVNYFLTIHTDMTAYETSLSNEKKGFGKNVTLYILKE